MIEQLVDSEISKTPQFSVRPATRADVQGIAALLLEGFGHEYRGRLRLRAARWIERVHALPGRLTGMAVAVDQQDTPIGVAGLRTREIYPRLDGLEERALFEELGVGASLLLDVRVSLAEPTIYHPRANEAFIYSVAVTAPWRGHGVGDALLGWLHGRAGSLGKTLAVLEVSETNQPARRLYQRHGYSIRRRRRSVLAWLRLGAPVLLLEKRLDRSA